MYQVTNLRKRQTTIALPGKGIILARKGDSDLILDSEFEEDTVQALIKARAIKVEKCSTGEAPVRSDHVARERKRIKVTHEAHDRAKQRARGTQPEQAQPSVASEESDKKETTPRVTTRRMPLAKQRFGGSKE